MLVVGQTVERYSVEAVLGQGSLAVVYRVRHNQLGTVHALKILENPRATRRQQLLREGRIQAGLRHPNVVQVTDVLAIDGVHALLMEFVNGPTLEDWLVDQEPSVATSLLFFFGICRGIQEAHHHGLVHCDLKPSNVLLAPTRTGFVPKVTDFGIAKRVLFDDPLLVATNGGMGTPAYMAPEQVTGGDRIDHQVDIFALGCILYELVCGRRAFGLGDVGATLDAIARGDYVSPASIVPDLPAGVVRAIEGALRPDPAERIADCHELLLTLGDGELPAEPSERVRDGWSPVSLEPGWRLTSIAPAKPRSPAVLHHRGLDSRQGLTGSVDLGADTVPASDRRSISFPSGSKEDEEHPPEQRRFNDNHVSWIAAVVLGLLIGLALLGLGLFAADLSGALG